VFDFCRYVSQLAYYSTGLVPRTRRADRPRRRLTPLIRKTQPYAKRVAHEGIWVEPELLAEIEYRTKSAEGKVRHPFFRGLREDLQ
jgi:bifunctional non-homologous end joining protein LigD